MPTKRILILTNRVPYPLNDGGNLAMNAMIQGYKKSGWQVYLLSMNTSRHYIERSESDKLYKDLHAFETVNVDNSVKPLNTFCNFLFSNKPSHAVRFYSEAYKIKLIETIAMFAPDVIQMESVFLATYLPVIKQHTKALNVLRLHNIEYQVWQRLATETRQAIKKKYLDNLAKRIKKYEEDVWPQFDLLVPITNTDAQVVMQNYPSIKVFTVPFGIDVANIPNNNKQSDWCGYHIGAMDWMPNKEGIKWFLHRVWPELHRQLPQFKFYFAGRNMPEYFKDINLEGVYCEGQVVDANTFIADKKILIVPIHSGGGIRIKVLEAMATGKVVISTTAGMQGIDAIPGRDYLLANTASEFVVAIQWVLSNIPEADKISVRARELIEKEYNSDTTTTKLIDYVFNMLVL